MLKGLQGIVLHLIKVMTEGFRAFRVQTQRQRVHEHADHGFKVRMGSSGNRGTNDDILLPGIFG
ncbi:hypothetical protein D3C81_1683090 [compost metagenome]